MVGGWKPGKVGKRLGWCHPHLMTYTHFLMTSTDSIVKYLNTKVFNII